MSRHAIAAGIAAWMLAAPAAGQDAGREPFRDVAAEAGLDFAHRNGRTGALYFSEMMGSGGAFLDYDGDGDLDVYLVQGGPLGKTSGTRPSDRLYRNELRPTGTLRFVDVTAASGLDSATGYGMGVATGDYDGDGRVDLYLANFGPNQLWRNRGDGTFEDVTAASGTGDMSWSVSASFLDYDRDGRLDLYVANYVDFALATHKTCRSPTGAPDYCSPLAYAPQPDRLYRNRGDGTFESVTAAFGLDRAPSSGLGVVAADLDDDGWVDLYVANDQAPNQLWLNQHGTGFRDEALLAGTALNADGRPEAGMGIALGDADGDGDEDLIVSHLNRETNTLYRNEGGGFFVDHSTESGLGLPSWESTGFGIVWLDVDLDGWLDLFVANGAVKHLEHLVQRRDPFPLHQLNQLFYNRGGGVFEEVTARSGAAFALSEVSRGAAAGDVDNDGDPDLLVTNNGGPVRLLINQVGQDRPWVGLRLVTGAHGVDALGARATVALPGRPRQMRRVHVDGSYESAQDPRLRFALGDEAPERIPVEIRWPSGQVERRILTRANRYYTLREPEK